MSQTFLPIKDRRKLVIKPARARRKRADEFKPLPLAASQMDWAVDKHFGWFVSLIQSGGAK